MVRTTDGGYGGGKLIRPDLIVYLNGLRWR